MGSPFLVLQSEMSGDFAKDRNSTVNFFRRMCSHDRAAQKRTVVWRCWRQREVYVDPVFQQRVPEAHGLIHGFQRHGDDRGDMLACLEANLLKSGMQTGRVFLKLDPQFRTLLHVLEGCHGGGNDLGGREAVNM